MTTLFWCSNKSRCTRFLNKVPPLALFLYRCGTFTAMPLMIFVLASPALSCKFLHFLPKRQRPVFAQHRQTGFLVFTTLLGCGCSCCCRAALAATFFRVGQFLRRSSIHLAMSSSVCSRMVVPSMKIGSPICLLDSSSDAFDKFGTPFLLSEDLCLVDEFKLPSLLCGWLIFLVDFVACTGIAREPRVQFSDLSER